VIAPPTVPAASNDDASPAVAANDDAGSTVAANDDLFAGMIPIARRPPF
jgi:hypothetical protein